MNRLFLSTLVFIAGVGLMVISVVSPRTIRNENVGSAGLTYLFPTSTNNVGGALVNTLYVIGKKSIYTEGHVTSTVSIHAPEFCIANSCRTTWPSASGGGGAGNVATSTADVSSYVTFFTSNAATPATIGGSVNFTWQTGLNKLSATNIAATNVTSTDIRTGTLNATTTTVGTFTAYSGGALNGLFTATDLRLANGGNASTTFNFFNSLSYGNSTVTNSFAVGSLFNARDGYASTTGSFNIGTTLGGLANTTRFGAGDLYVGRNATASTAFSVGSLFNIRDSYASTTGFFSIGTSKGSWTPSAGDLFVSNNATVTSNLAIGTDATAGTKKGCLAIMSSTGVFTYMYFNGTTQVIDANSCSGASTSTVIIGQ